MKTDPRKYSLFLWRKYLPIVIVCLVIVFISYFMGPIRYFQRIILLIVLWAAIASGFNIISGYGGQIVFGYMMFVGTGAYTAVLFFKFLQMSPWVGMWLGAIIAGILALLIGLPTLHLHGAYFAVATVAFPLITSPILNHLGFEEVSIPFAGQGPYSMQFSDIRSYVLMGVLSLAAILIIIRRIEQSRFGFALRAIKQNETAAEGMGINTFRIKLMAFVLSAAIGAITGSIYAVSSLLVLTTHAVFGVFIIVKILSINIVGGQGTLWGPVIAAVVLVPIGEFLSAQLGARTPGVQDIVYGAALVAAIIYMPEGIWGKISIIFRSSPQNLAPTVKPIALEALSQDIPNNKLAPARIKFEYIQTKIMKNSQPDSILKIEDVSKSFGGVRALQDVNIIVPNEKILGIIGPNGAGKTTLFNVINGYLKPDKGRVLFEGKDITYFKPHALCKMGIGRTFQVVQIFYNMTVLENVMIGAFAKVGNTANARTVAEDVVQKMGLINRTNDHAVGLTIWEAKMVELSRALATQPKLLLVDEPMAGLNPEETNQLGQIIKTIAKAGITVIIIEHVVQSLLKIADLMVGLDEGRKVADGTPEEVTSNPHIIEAYLGTKWKNRYAKS